MAVRDRMVKKVEVAGKRERRRRARKSAWDEVNGTGKEERRQAIMGEVEGEDKDDWEDEEEQKKGDGLDTEMKTDEGVTLTSTAATAEPVASDMTITANDTDEEDKIT